LDLDFDDLTHRRPFPECLMLAPSLETRADFNVGGAIEPTDTLTGPAVRRVAAARRLLAALTET
jgi:hypothetical protein